MNILVTGATGFIGRHLTAALSKTHFVRCLVRTSSDTSVLRNLAVEIVYAGTYLEEMENGVSPKFGVNI
jgi:nucleoside-diphosphate-sugar epimerase